MSTSNLSHSGRSSVTELVGAARSGDHDAWTAIVQRYQPLVLSLARRHRLSEPDTQDVSQTVWLTLFDSLDRIREPRALPGWIQTTTTHCCLAVLKAHRSTLSYDPHATDDITAGMQPGGLGPTDELDAALLRQHTQQAIRQGLAELAPKHRQLLLLLAADPPLSYQEISRRLGIPIGSIGPTRARSLERLRNTTAVRHLLADDSQVNASASAA